MGFYSTDLLGVSNREPRANNPSSIGHFSPLSLSLSLRSPCHCLLLSSCLNIVVLKFPEPTLERISLPTGSGSGIAVRFKSDCQSHLPNVVVASGAVHHDGWCTFFCS
jgi:hypothetical protein